jgi:hypoxanthine phosphoribosyltransferase
MKYPFIGVLNGSFMVVSDFMKSYKGACELSFVKWLPMKGSTNEVKELIGNQDLAGRSVIIEDIVDTGNTIEELFHIFSKQNVKKLKVATLS